MKISLIGHGYIGSAIARELAAQQVAFSWHRHTDVIEESDLIINAAGFTGVPNVDACEDRKEETIIGNILWPLKLEQACGDIPIIHIGSGCVYTGHKDGGWTEEDPPNFSFDNGSFYSGTKALGQKVLAPYLHKSYLFRIRMPFGKENHPKNYFTKLRQYPKLIDVTNSLSRVDDVAKAAVWFSLNRPPYGIYNVCNEGNASARNIVQRMGLEKEWVTQEEFSKMVKAPRSTCVLHTGKLTSVYPMPHIVDAVRECL